MRLSHIKNNRGQSMVEMALLLPILLVLFIVTFDLGRGIYYYSAIYNAAREGARYGIITPEDSTGIINTAKKLTIGLNQDQLNIVPCECGKSPCTVVSETCPLNTVKVNIQYNFQLVTPLASLVTGSEYFTLRTSSMMKIER